MLLTVMTYGNTFSVKGIKIVRLVISSSADLYLSNQLHLEVLYQVIKLLQFYNHDQTILTRGFLLWFNIVLVLVLFINLLSSLL